RGGQIGGGGDDSHAPPIAGGKTGVFCRPSGPGNNGFGPLSRFTTPPAACASPRPQTHRNGRGEAALRALSLLPYRDHTCGALRPVKVGETVRLSGWVHRVRDHGGLLFIDLRDHYGLTQVVADPDSPAFKTAEKVRAEWVIRVDGKLKARTPETVNPNMPTG